MSRPRGHSEASKHPHSVSLKVLRLSRPFLTHQHPLPTQSPDDEFRIDPSAAISHPGDSYDDQFILSPLLTLPPSFGAAHVGETFACTLCANNELPEKQENEKQSTTISGVRITAEMQTPSSQPQSVALDVMGGEGGEEGHSPHEPKTIAPGETLQQIVKHDLREEGMHVLAVTVAYTETQVDNEGEEGLVGAATGGRIRTFRKLYQFNAVQLLSVRTKVQLLPASFSAKKKEEESEKVLATYVLEAQLENLSEGIIVLDKVSVIPKQGFEAVTLNAWESDGAKDTSKPILGPKDVMQIAFLLKKVDDTEDEIENGRVLICQLSIQWRSRLGEKGFLSTGWLSGKKGE